MADCSNLYISEGRITEIGLTYYSGNGEKHKPHSMRFRSLEHRLANFFETFLDLKFKVELINLLEIKLCGLGSRIRDVEAF